MHQYPRRWTLGIMRAQKNRRFTGGVLEVFYAVSLLIIYLQNAQLEAFGDG